MRYMIPVIRGPPGRMIGNMHALKYLCPLVGIGYLSERLVIRVTYAVYGGPLCENIIQDSILCKVYVEKRWAAAQYIDIFF